MTDILIYIVVEDELSEAVLRKLINDSAQPFNIAVVFGRMGNSFIEKNITRFNNYAKGLPVIILTDLDNKECPPKLRDDWLGKHTEKMLLFAVAVKEVEAWIMADRSSFSKFLKIKISTIPLNIESIRDPQKFLIGLVKKSPNKSIKEDIVPPKGSARVQGPGYNEILTDFVENKWDTVNAAENSESLEWFISKINSFNP